MQPEPSTFQPISDTPKPSTPSPLSSGGPTSVSSKGGRKKKIIALLVLVVSVGILVSLSRRGALLSPTDDSVRTSTTPFTEVPAVFSQSGTVTAVSATKLTIRYVTGATTTTITFPLSPTTPVFTIKKTTENESVILSESPAQLTDIKVGEMVAVQIPSRTLEALALLKVQIFPK